MRNDLPDLTALDARDRMVRGEFTALDYCEALLRRIAEREPDVGAFAHFDADFARTQAKACDAHRATGRATGPHLDWRINWFNERIDPAFLVGPMPTPDG